MATTLTPQEIRSFVLDTLRVSGCPYREIDEHLLMAEVIVEIPPIFFDPARLEKQTLNLVFEPKWAGKYPGAELVTMGSYRLDWFIEGLKERGAVTLQSYTYDLIPARTQREILKLLQIKEANFYFHQPFLKIHPHLLANYRLSYRTDEIEEEIVSLGIDMVTGEITEDFLPTLPGPRLTPKIPKGKIEKQSFPLEEAFERLSRRLSELVKEKDSSWIEESRKRYEEELCYLYAYYQDGEKVDTPEFRARADEIYKKYRPQVFIHLINVGLLYLPEVIYTLHAKSGDTTLPPLRYRPALSRVDWAV
ncbi:MAG TPA: YqhG family protein [Bacillota bacterium]